MEHFRYRSGHWNYKYPTRTERRDLHSPVKFGNNEWGEKKGDSDDCHELQRVGIVEPVMS
jgi:hypothetical protein